jgi:cold shock CspA family protein
MRGMIDGYSTATSYGFVESITEGSIFFHVRAWRGGDPAQIQNGLLVEFDIENVKGKGKYRHKTQQRAANVRPVVDPDPEPEEEVEF